ncbi:hypothetical protein Sjap_020260 [Stephania japonica]|uniref:Uncharacterized protein n=1 Tax=Stephania japonica TaxID=461633 RepID=A0AAP0I045_9MAGN
MTKRASLLTGKTDGRERTAGSREDKRAGSILALEFTSFSRGKLTRRFNACTVVINLIVGFSVQRCFVLLID